LFGVAIKRREGGIMGKPTRHDLEGFEKKVDDHISREFSNSAEAKAEEVVKKIGKVLGEQVDRAHRAIEKEVVTKEEQLGIGAKIGMGLGIVGKRLAEKPSSFLAKLIGSGDLVAGGRTIGAKAEKIVKRAVKEGIEKVAARQDGKKEE
jgi:hypothetical protein